MTVLIRPLSEADLEAADAILRSAFQRAESWRTELRLFLTLQPDGLFLASQRGLPAGMVATILYSNYAYVGLMGVHQDFHRQGLGLALMEHVLAWTSERKVPLVRLDASQTGQPLYEKLGFVPFNEVYVCQRQVRPIHRRRPKEVQLMAPHHLDLIAAFDTRAFGAERTKLLHYLRRVYPQRAFLLSDEPGHASGYLIAQEKRIGPWVMEDPANAEQLLVAALSLQFEGLTSVIVPAENAQALTLLQSYGFETVRVNRHMMRGLGAPVGQREKIYAQASLSLG